MRHSSLIDRLKTWRLGLFLILACILGGTSQTVMPPKLVLYLISIPIIGWVIYKFGLLEILTRTKTLSLVFGGFILLALLQIIPLPPSIWSNLPGRSIVSEGYGMLDYPMVWMPLSMAPDLTVLSILNIIPPLAAFLLTVHVSNRQEQNFAIKAIILFTVVSIIFGVLQTLGGLGTLRPYAITNNDLPVGFFSNANHQATLILMVVPMAIAYLQKSVSSRDSRVTFLNAESILYAGLLMFFVFGVVISTSIAGYILLLLALLLCLACMPFGRKIRIKPVTILVAFGIAAFILFLSYDALIATEGLKGIEARLSTLGQMSRGTVYERTLDFMPEYMPFGSGLGSYPDIYRIHEDVNIVNRVFLPHAHNDYLELLVDLGAFAGVLILVFVVWWIRSFGKILGLGRKGSSLAKGASIGVLLVLLHSLVDYPMRTLAVSTVLAFYLGLVIRRGTEKALF